MKNFKVYFGVTIALVGLLLVGVSQLPTDQEKVNENESSVLQASTTKSFSHLDVESFARNIDSGTLLDIRTPEEYEQQYIENSRNIDFYNENFQNELEKLDKNEAYYIYCRSGNRSGQALELMRELGFTEVYDLQGGITSWNTAGKETMAF